MTELSNLISRLKGGIQRNSSYLKTIRNPQLLVSSLQELYDLIGNDKVKDSVATQISHLILIKRRALDNSNIKEDEVMLNTVLYGPPGVGKTLIGTKLAKIWYSLGYLTPKSKVKKSDFSDGIRDLMKNNGVSTGSSSADDVALTVTIMIIVLIIFIFIGVVIWSLYNRVGGSWTIGIVLLIFLSILIIGYYVYVTISGVNNNNPSGCNGKNCPIENKSNNHGNSSIVPPSDEQIIKVVTRSDFVQKYVGWSSKDTLKLLEDNLGKVLFVDEAYSLVTDMHDSFGMEVLTTINLFLSQHPGEIIIIFAGYKDLMEAGIFSFQPGLKRRFMWQFDCSGYTDEQLFGVFKAQLNKKGWKLSDEHGTKLLFKQNKDAFPSFGGDTERLTYFSELEHSRDFMDDESGLPIDELTVDHIKRGLLKLRENNIETKQNEVSNNPMANMMKLFNGKKDIMKLPPDNLMRNFS